MTTIRLLCIASTSNPIQVPPGIPPSAARFYSANQGAVIDAGGDITSDAAVLLNTGNFILIGQSGPTSGRPTYPRNGTPYINTDVDPVTWFDGATWRQANGEAADTQTATALWTTSSTTISLPTWKDTEAAAPWITDGMDVYDVSNGETIGIVQSVDGLTLTLTADAAHASAGSSDVLLFY